jgi:outer membrane lipoprotein-sorting protein
MRKRRLLVLAVLVALPCIAARAQAPDAQLTAALAQLDTASQRFQHARADFVWEFYERVARDTTTQNGVIYFDHGKGGAVAMGAVVNDNGKKSKILEYKGGSLRLFDLAQDSIRTMNAGANQAEYETFLTLGFGGSGRDLSKAWNITYQGTEMMTDDGKPVKVDKLDLISKDKGVQNMFTHITIWVDTARAVTLKQVFETPAHDRRTATYTHIKLNAPLDMDTFAIKPGKRTTYVH